MPFKIVRNDITKMNTEAIVNTANEQPVVGAGCDRAVYTAAGYDELLAYRKEHIGAAEEGSAFLTPGFGLPAKYIIHAVSPLYRDGSQGEEEKLRSCYRSSLKIAAEHGIMSVAFPLISTGSYGYPREDGMRIAIDEIHSFLLTHDLMIFLVVFDDKMTQMGRRIDPDLEAFIDRHYVRVKRDEEYAGTSSVSGADAERDYARPSAAAERDCARYGMAALHPQSQAAPPFAEDVKMTVAEEDAAYEELEQKLEERLRHRSDTFPEYLMYLIRQKGLKNADVYRRAIIDKKVFSKIKNNPDYHPQKITALCLCIGAMLNMDESRDLLARAGYALSPCDKTDIIFAYFIENEIYDMIELDIRLEEHGLPCLID